MSNYTKKAIKNSAIVLIVLGLTMLLSFSVRLILAKNLSQSDYGLFYSVIAITGFFTAIRGFGVDKSLVKFIPEFKVKKKMGLIKSSIMTVFTIEFIFAAIITSLLFIFSSYLSVYYFKDPKSVFVLQLLALSFLFSALLDPFIKIFQGFQRMFLYSFVDLLRFLVIFITSLVLLGLGNGILAPAIAYLITPLFLSVIFSIVFIKDVFPSFFSEKTKISKNLLNNLFHFGIPLLLTSAGGIVITYTDTMILTYFTSLKDVGVYNAALPLARLVFYMTSSVVAVLLPLTSELWTKKLYKLLKEGIRLLYRYSAMILIPFVVVLFYFAGDGLSFLFGSEYAAGENVLRLLLIGVMFFSLANLNFSLITGMGKPIFVTKMMFFAAVLNLILNFILIPTMGIMGAAISTTIAYVMLLFFSIYYLKKIIQFKIPWWNWFKNLIAGGLIFLVIYFSNMIILNNVLLKIILLTLISIITYVLFIYWFNLLDFKEIRLIINRVKSK